MSDLIEGMNKELYDKLTPERKLIVDSVIANLEKGTLWKQGWVMPGRPVSGVNGKPYKGVNNFNLTLNAMHYGYSDNRWITYKQMESKGWSFKKDEEGNSLGKNRGVTVEYYELRDKETKKPFDRSVLDGMTEDEKHEYYRDNIYPIRKYYRVFNGDLIEGIPEREKRDINPNEIVEDAEQAIQAWSDNEAKIIHGGGNAYYIPAKDEIHLPNKSDFSTLYEYYLTAGHEIAHSTGHGTRLNREMNTDMSSTEYATEELRAQIASMFQAQKWNIPQTSSQLENESAYVSNWLKEIKNDPNVLFTAIADAEKISKYMTDKTQFYVVRKDSEPFAIETRENEYGEPTYVVYMAEDYGQIRPAINYAFSSRESLMTEFDKFRQAPFWKDKHFEEVSMDELQQRSIERYEQKEKEAQAEEESQVFIPPSKLAAKGTAETITTVDMTGKGIDSLTKMADRDIVEKAMKGNSGEKFNTLYNGGTLFNIEEKDERSLMTRLAVFCGKGQEQLLRIFRSSGQFRADKGEEYYLKIAEQSMAYVSNERNKLPKPATNVATAGKAHVGRNAKT